MVSVVSFERWGHLAPTGAVVGLQVSPGGTGVIGIWGTKHGLGKG